MENVEIEIQVKVENSQPLLEFLDKNAQFKEENRQIDEYYSPAHRDFAAARPNKEWFRLRDSSGKYSLNYKNFYYDSEGKSTYCDEYELVLGDANQMRKILSSLNFKNIIIADKVRKSWDYKDWEISMDSVKGLGDFVEIEYKGKDDADPKQIAAEMIKFLKDIGCGKIQRNYVGYPFQLLFPEEIKFEEQ